jgi:FHA domain
MTTTHDPNRGGHPRLIFAVGPTPMVDPAQGPELREVPLRLDLMALGSSPKCDLVLPETDPFQASIRHDETDEYVFVQESGATVSAINGERMGSHVLRTGDRLEIGPWTLTYRRDEVADHGRPHGGRQGGEGAVQQAQPPRSQVSGAREPDVVDVDVD